MAITDIVVSGKLFQDDGDPVEGATVQLLETGTSTVEATYTDGTTAAGLWTLTEDSLDTTYDVKISSGSSVRYILWSDEISLKGVDTASLKIRGAASAAAPLYFIADAGDDNADIWTFQAADGAAFTFESFASGSSVAHLTINANSTVASSSVVFPGILDVNGSVDWDVTDVQVDSSGDIDLVSTNDAAAAIYLRENAGTSGTIKIHADQGTSVTEGAESINILSDAGGVGIRSTANLAKAVNITSDGGTTGSIAIFNDQGTSVTEGAESISLLSDAGGVGIRSTANLANALNLTVDGGTTSSMTLFNDTGTTATEGSASIQLLSDVGGINVKSGLNGANAILLTADGGTSETIVIHADQGTGTGSIELLSDAGGIELDAGTDITLDAGGADIFLKDDGTLFGTLNNNSGELLIKSSSSGTTAATFSGANVTFAGTVDATTDFTVGSTVITDDSIVMTPSTSDTVTIAGATHGILNVTTVDAAGTAADVNIDADGEIVIDAADAAGAIFKIAGTAQLSVIDGAILPTTDNDIDLGSGSYQFKDAYINGTLEADAITIGGTNVVTGSLITTLGTISAGVWQGTAIASGYIAADAITGAKIADDAIDSEHYTDGSIDNAHIADDAIDSEHYADGSIDNAHIADDAIDSEHYADGSIDNAHIADDAIDSEHYADASIDFAHIQNVAANSILGRNANSSGVLSEVALATTQLLIGDGTGFTAAALSGDATMTNAGVVSLAAAQTNVTSLLATDIKIGEDAQTVIDFETANEIHFDADNAERVKIDSTGLNVVSGSLETATIDYTDGDLAITIADGGGITAAAGITSTAAANSFGATSFSGDASLTDNTKVTLGTGGDADIYYDATDMVINTRVAGSGDLVTHSQLVWGTGVAVTAADYSIGRDADGTNQLHFNVPTGAGYEFSVNDGARLLITTNGSIRLYGGGVVGSLDFAWTFDTDTGFFRPNADQVSLVAAGVAVAGWDAKGLNTGGLYTARSSQQPTRAINLFNGQPPIGTLADGATVYSESGQMNTMDSAGVAMRLSGGTIDTSSGDLTLNPAGNIYTADDVGIGVSPSDVLHISATKGDGQPAGAPLSGGLRVDDAATADEGTGGGIFLYGKYSGHTRTVFAAIHASKEDDSSDYDANLVLATRVQAGNTTEKMRITYDGSVQIGGTASHGTTRGTGILSLFNVSQAPVGTLANGAAIYCEGGVMKVINADGSGGTIDFS